METVPWWIRKAIAHTLAERAGATSLPVKQLGRLLKIAKAYRRYVQIEKQATEHLCVKVKMRALDDYLN
ncbi:MAG TPA: hypothetical protein VGC99_24630 [Candidatus Tectomicrobia bacterium]